MCSVSTWEEKKSSKENIAPHQNHNGRHHKIQDEEMDSVSNESTTQEESGRESESNSIEEENSKIDKSLLYVKSNLSDVDEGSLNGDAANDSDLQEDMDNEDPEDPIERGSNVERVLGGDENDEEGENSDENSEVVLEGIDPDDNEDENESLLDLDAAREKHTKCRENEESIQEDEESVQNSQTSNFNCEQQGRSSQIGRREMVCGLGF